MVFKGSGKLGLLRPLLTRSSRTLAMILVFTTWPYLLYMLRGAGFPVGSGSLRGGAAYQEEALVRVAIRVHKQQDLLVRSLIWALRAQQTAKTKVDFVLIPTEPQSVVFFQNLAHELNSQALVTDVKVLELPDSFFSKGRADNPYVCTPEVRAGYVESEGEADTHKICDFDHYVYYLATDKAITDMVAPCEGCTHVIVTNGDNMYAPSFLRETLQRDADMAVTAICHAGMALQAQMKLGHIDLGAVLFKKRVLRGGKKTFLSSLPPGAGAKQVHDADYWFFQEAVDSGVTVSVIEDVLFYHH